MALVSRDIDPEAAHDLLRRAPRACVCRSAPTGPVVTPAPFRWDEGRYLIGPSATATDDPAAGEEVVVLIDEGVHWFDLRAIVIRGAARHAAAPPGAGTSGRWFEIIPTKIVAWDYGELREVGDDG